MSVVHLSETGFNAGRRLCLSTQEKSVHAAYAPLHRQEFRAGCCPECLKVWALEAYEDGDEMPDWVIKIRSEREAAKAT